MGLCLFKFQPHGDTGPKLRLDPETVKQRWEAHPGEEKEASVHMTFLQGTTRVHEDMRALLTSKELKTLSIFCLN